MTRSTALQEEPTVQVGSNIDHPALGTFLNAFIDTPDAGQRAALRTRYGIEQDGTDNERAEYVNRIIEVLGNISASAAINRQQHERAATGAGGLALSEAEKVEYSKYIGKPETISEYVCWFGEVALNYFTQTQNNQNKNFNKIGLEIGGKMQGGDWESTTDLDNMIQELHVQSKRLPQLDSGSPGTTPGRRPIYRFMPLEVDPDSHQFDFGVIRRRRGEIDLRLRKPNLSSKDRPLIKVFKVSLGLVVMPELDPEQRDSIQKDVLAHPDENRMFSYNRDDNTNKPQNNTDAALVAGSVFEVDIKSPAGTSKGIIPICAYDVMCTERT